VSDGESILVWNTRDPLRGRTAAEFEAALREKLAGRVEQAWLFGSWGTPDFGHDSDIDVMLVVNTDKPFLERARDYFGTMDPSPGFWSSAVASMKRVR